MCLREQGVSLVEILITLAISAILLAQLDLAGWGRTREEKIIAGVMTDIVNAISLARQTAVMENVMVTFCRSDDGMHCQGQWHEGSIIFTDRNSDRVLNDEDRLLYRLDTVPMAGSLKFRSFGNKQYLQLTPFGMTNYQNGNFTYCPEDGDVTLARQVIVSVTGRTRYARDNDGDGVVENSQGTAVACD